MSAIMTHPGSSPAKGCAQANQALTILLMSGREDGGKRATLAFVAAASAAAMERPVQVFWRATACVGATLVRRFRPK